MAPARKPARKSATTKAAAKSSAKKSPAKSAAKKPAAKPARAAKSSKTTKPTLRRKAASSADSVDLHAWAEAYIPGAGWVGLDPTSGLLTGEGHIPLAATSQPGDAMPIEGTTAPAHGLTLDQRFQRRIAIVSLRRGGAGGVAIEGRRGPLHLRSKR